MDREAWWVTVHAQLRAWAGITRFGHNLGRDGQQKGKASFLLFYLNTYFISSKSSFFSSEDSGVLCDVGPSLHNNGAQWHFRRFLLKQVRTGYRWPRAEASILHLEALPFSVCIIWFQGQWACPRTGWGMVILLHSWPSSILCPS